MPTYRLQPAAIKMLRWRILLRALPVFAIPLVLLPFLHWRIQGFTLPVLCISLVLSTAAIGLGLRRGLVRSTQGLETYELTLCDDSALRRQAYLPDLCLSRSEVTSIVEGRHGSLVLRGRDPRALLIVPPGIEGKEEIRLLLSSWQPIGQPRGFLRSPWGFFLSITVPVVLVAVVMLSMNAWIVVPGASLLVALMLWAAREIRKSPNVDERVKKNTVVFAVVVVVSVLKALLTLGIFRY